ncbi:MULTISPECIES: YciI family protein [Nocardia]|uniref:YciI family protein n=1 Tax=Nocardia TaxID=1817 RepID=UPI000D68D305|nr:MULTISPECIES: YciI family protein [Nocardia]
MKFVLNVYLDAVDPEAPAVPHRVRATDDEEFAATVARSGELIDAHVFADPSTNTVVRYRDGALLVSDGPYVGAIYATSCYVLDCENLARAVELAASHPATRQHAVEIRPLMSAAGWEM